MFKGDMRTKALSAVVFLVVAFFGGQQVLGSTDTPADVLPDSTELVSSESDGQRFTDLPIIELGDLPPEAIETLDRIETGAPHPYSKDGSTFENREGLLPDHEIGHYQEFTVDTPGASDRGARRIVTGDDGEQFYTADHYGSFSEIVE